MEIVCGEAEASRFASLDGWLAKAVGRVLAAGPLRRLVSALTPGGSDAEFFDPGCPEVPADGGHWIAVRADGAQDWLVSDPRLPCTDSRCLSATEFYAFAAQVAERNGEMVRCYDEDSSLGTGRVSFRTRSVGYRLDGDTAAMPAVTRFEAGTVERVYFRHGCPAGREVEAAEESFTPGR